MSLKPTLFIAACAAIITLPACTTIAKATGATKSTPNEFNILTKAPLVVPPEYSLRPPQAGQSRPEDSYSSQVAREAILGEVDEAKPSPGEVMLMTQAGVGRANPEVRLVIDGQNNVEHKSDGLTNRILFWRDGRPPAGAESPIDPDLEAKRLEAINSATGGGEVVIQKRPVGRKLPGL